MQGSFIEKCFNLTLIMNILILIWCYESRSFFGVNRLLTLKYIKMNGWSTNKLLLVVVTVFSFSLVLAAGDGENSAVAAAGASVLKMGRFQVGDAKLIWLLVQHLGVVPACASSVCRVQDLAVHLELVKAGLQMLFPFRAETAQSVQVWSSEHRVSSWLALAVGLGL